MQPLISNRHNCHEQGPGGKDALMINTEFNDSMHTNDNGMMKSSLWAVGDHSQRLNLTYGSWLKYKVRWKIPIARSETGKLLGIATK